MRRVWTLLVVLTAVMAGAASSALAHPERQSYFPDASKGAVPKYKHTATPLIVCKKNSKRLIKKAFKGKARARTKRIRLRQLKKCHFRHIQSAVNTAKTNDRIQIMPGLYKEEPSRKVSINEPACATMFETPDDGDKPVPTFEAQAKCPNMRNLIAVIGDSLSDPDRECDQKCNLLIEGMGRRPKDVVIEGDRLKRVQRRRRRRDQRLPPAPAHHPLRPELRRAQLRLRPRPLRAHRRLRQRRLRHLPGLGP